VYEQYDMWDEDNLCEPSFPELMFPNNEQEEAGEIDVIYYND
jgi:hypothetical protein